MRRQAWRQGALAIVVAACSGPGGAPAGDGGAPATAGSTGAPAAATGGTGGTGGTVAGPTAVPFHVEVKRAALALLEVRNEVFQHPDVARVAEYVAPTCLCLDRERAIVQGLVDDGLRWTAPPVVPRGVLVDDPDPNGPSLTVVAEQPASAIVGADGTPAQDVPGIRAAVYGISLARDVASEWRINELDGVELGEDAIAAVIAEGLP